MRAPEAGAPEGAVRSPAQPSYRPRAEAPGRRCPRGAATARAARRGPAPRSPPPAPSPRPARSPLPPSRLLPPLPPSAAAARRTRSLAGTGAQRRGGPGSERRSGAGPGGPSLSAAPGGDAGAPGDFQPFSRPPCDPLAARGTEAAARPTPRRGRRDGNLRWELYALQPRRAPPSRRAAPAPVSWGSGGAAPGGAPKPTERRGWGDGRPGAAGGGVGRARRGHGAGPAEFFPRGTRGAKCWTFSAAVTRHGAHPGCGGGVSPPGWIPRGGSLGGSLGGGASVTRSLTPSLGTEWSIPTTGLY